MPLLISRDAVNQWVLGLAEEAGENLLDANRELIIRSIH